MNNSAIVKQINTLQVLRGKKLHSINQLGFLSVPLMSEKRILDMEDIFYLKSDSNYTTIHLESNKFVVSKTLKWFTSKLNIQFFRVHQSFLINRPLAYPAHPQVPRFQHSQKSCLQLT